MTEIEFEQALDALIIESGLTNAQVADVLEQVMLRYQEAAEEEDVEDG